MITLQYIIIYAVNRLEWNSDERLTAIQFIYMHKNVWTQNNTFDRK